ncbi:MULTISPECIES: 6,7-dimethyl-8-ribityllumazine synthase [Pandoraea]|uniref:6,7-dimethyl-8-ribityllumazine synthase n=1 Tax=Pandoraea TaxID=93217 RepID=UPI001F5C334A|nr:MULTISPECIES: 6,7-dimethyl-8-ribityllumazine synthase [Pandoraea]MCI3205261.1 6,7-dimethyl-8-ribityllumazine synthase [Pandoraea sp. LA3]MDN4583289.1 6,7-dimethyl-8-ribityllumazine synthase [Pandoraea capi]
MTQLQNPSVVSGRRIAFVQSSWHKNIVDNCRAAFVQGLAQANIAESNCDFFEVAGAFEIPLHAKLLAKTGKYAAIACAGLVVDGGIYRHEFVAQAVISGLMQVQLETEVVVLSAVLTPHHFHTSDEHNNFFREHFLVKGRELAHACSDTIEKVMSLKDEAFGGMKHAA